MLTTEAQFIRVLPVSDLQGVGCKTVHANGHTIVLFAYQDTIYALDNRCPHMGFPLDKGSVSDGILTCHWHHARFDLETGGTFNQFADDVPTFPVEIRDGDIWVDVAQHHDPREHQRQRLEVGLERDIPLVIGKAIFVLLSGDGDAVEPFRAGLEFGTTYRQTGWGSGLTMHTCMMNMLPHLDAEDRPRALYHGLSAVSRESFRQAPRFQVRPLPDSDATDIDTLKGWFRQFIAVRDAEGAERCVVSAIRAGADHQQMADMLFSAVTDFRYIAVGHPADFTNKAFEALDHVGWDAAELVLTSLVRDYALGARMEESNSWRHPIDLVEILEDTFAKLSFAVEAGRNATPPADSLREALADVLHGDDPQAIVDALLNALEGGYGMIELASAVSYAAALRVARFHTSNEFPDWDTALHTFTFANAIEHGLRRAPSVDTLRGVFDAAMSIYLDRFLNIPAARIPTLEPKAIDAPDLLAILPTLLDQQQQVTTSAEVVAQYFANDGDDERLLAMLGKLLLREDRDFHTIQMVEAAMRQYGYLKNTDTGTHVLIAAIRYLAAHSPTVRAQGQTYEIAHRLHRGDDLFVED